MRTTKNSKGGIEKKVKQEGNGAAVTNLVQIAPQNIKSKKPTAISTESDYNAVMSKIDELMSKGSKNVNKGELSEIRRLALLAQAYEKSKYIIELPSTFAGLIEMKMYELRLKQTELAKKLHVSDTKLSLIMSGKQKPDVLFLKAVHHELNVDANLLLEAV